MVGRNLLLPERPLRIPSHTKETFHAYSLDTSWYVDDDDDATGSNQKGKQNYVNWTMSVTWQFRSSSPPPHCQPTFPARYDARREFCCKESIIKLIMMAKRRWPCRRSRTGRARAREQWWRWPPGWCKFSLLSSLCGHKLLHDSWVVHGRRRHDLSIERMYYLWSLRIQFNLYGNVFINHALHSCRCSFSRNELWWMAPALCAYQLLYGHWSSFIALPITLRPSLEQIDS